MTTANDDAAAMPPAPPDEPEAVLDALFRGPRERFVAERNAAAKRLAAAGRGKEAAALRGLPKPSVSAWAVNQLWWAARPEVEALLAAGRRQAEGLRAGAGPAEQAAATQARRRALQALEAAVTEVLQTAGHVAGAATLRRIATTLEALAAHAAHGDGPRIGRLTVDLDPPGFELVARLAAAPGVAAPVEPAPASADASLRRETEAAVAEAEREQQRARERAEQAARTLDQVTREADEAELAAQRTAQVHHDARARAEAARQLADEAEREALRARAHARRERERSDAARKALAEHTAELQRRDEALLRARQRLAGLDPG